MLICVDTDASRDCGAGDTVTREPASAAETSSRGGTQLGRDARFGEPARVRRHVGAGARGAREQRREQPGGEQQRRAGEHGA